MILSNGKPCDLKLLNDQTLAAEEKIFFSRYKTAYRNTIGCKAKDKFDIALENEILSFNYWRNLYDERIRRDDLKMGRR